MSRRMIIEGDWRRHVEGDGWYLAGSRPTGCDWAISIPDGVVTAVEEVPEPLPTEPGETFWGQRNGDRPRRWFVKVDDRLDERPLIYVPDAGMNVADIEAAGLGLVRLPEPDDAGVSNLTLAFVVLAALIFAGAAPAGTAAFGLVAVAALAVLGLFGVRAAGAAVARRGGGSQ